MIEDEKHFLLCVLALEIQKCVRTREAVPGYCNPALFTVHAMLTKHIWSCSKPSAYIIV